ncbi:MAG TPA: TIGR02757 family protein, partial [Bacteroidia bacterium]
MKPDPKIKLLLETGYERYNRPDFISNDPISLPHLFKKKEDIEIIGFFVSIIAWGQRKSIINSGLKMIELMQNAPHDFILHHTENDLKKCSKFVHRTFNGDDFLSLIGFIQSLYLNNGGLEFAFSSHLKKKDNNVGPAISGFRKLFENSPYFVDRTKKHIASPDKGSACKRINMYLRWMVRKDDKGVDFGLWKTIRMDQLVCPLDVHVLNQAKTL